MYELMSELFCFGADRGRHGARQRLGGLFLRQARLLCAERMARTEGHIGAVAFSRSGDPGSGEFGMPYC